MGPSAARNWLWVHGGSRACWRGLWGLGCAEEDWYRGEGVGLGRACQCLGVGMRGVHWGIWESAIRTRTRVRSRISQSEEDIDIANSKST